MVFEIFEWTWECLHRVRWQCSLPLPLSLFASVPLPPYVRDGACLSGCLFMFMSPKCVCGLARPWAPTPAPSQTPMLEDGSARQGGSLEMR